MFHLKFSGLWSDVYTYQSKNKQELKSNLKHIETSTKTKIRKIIQILLTVDCLKIYNVKTGNDDGEKQMNFFFLTGEGLWKQWFEQMKINED